MDANDIPGFACICVHSRLKIPSSMCEATTSISESSMAHWSFIVRRTVLNASSTGTPLSSAIHLSINACKSATSSRSSCRAIASRKTDSRSGQMSDAVFVPWRRECQCSLFLSVLELNDEAQRRSANLRLNRKRINQHRSIWPAQVAKAPVPPHQWQVHH